MVSLFLKAILYDAKNDSKYCDVAPLLIRCKTETLNRDFVTRVFPRLAQFTCCRKVLISLMFFIVFLKCFTCSIIAQVIIEMRAL